MLSRRNLLIGGGAASVLGGLSMGLNWPALAQGTGARSAFVVGVSGYRQLRPLLNPAHDADDIAAVLERAGFALFDGRPQLDQPQALIRAGLTRYADALPEGAVSVFYFAGHGFQIGRTNYLTGQDAPAAPTGSLEQSYLALPELMRTLDRSRAALNIVILDACRNDPFPAEAQNLTGAGLARIDAPTRTLISYSTQPGNVALDGQGRNSPYAAALIAAMQAPSSTVLEVFNTTGLSVQSETHGKQVPWVTLSPIPTQLAFSDTLTTAAPIEVPTACDDSEAAMRAPIERLFAAWRDLDIAAYEAQWAQDAFQVAGRIQRARPGIIATRRKFFPRLKRVEITGLAPQFMGRTGDLAFFLNTYTMSFHLRTGRVIAERDVQEAYTLRCTPGRGWQIKENYDYIDRNAKAAAAARRSRQ
ncbi:MAG: caspase family protein [Neomegalonema sp.]|nr:caspase family protein [Neomegalonema sp.]